MKIQWNPDSIRWFREASEYTGYNKILSSLLMEHIPHRNTICDMGCGAALIDFEFAKYFEHVTCVDISQEAIDSVNNYKNKCGIINLDAVCCDGEVFSGSFDTVIALFHGGSNIFENYYPLAKEQLIIVTHLGNRHTFSPKKRHTQHNYGVTGTTAFLENRNIVYHYMEQSIEYGQPFKSMEDAMSFMNLYGAPGMDEEEKRTHLEAKLIKTGKADFPYYMPHQKNMGIFIINKWENPSQK